MKTLLLIYDYNKIIRDCFKIISKNIKAGFIK